MSQLPEAAADVRSTAAFWSYYTAAEVRVVKVRILFFVFKVSASFNDSEKGVFLYRGTHVRIADMSPI